MKGDVMSRTIGVIGTGEIARMHMEAVGPLGWKVAGCGAGIL